MRRTRCAPSLRGPAGGSRRFLADAREVAGDGGDRILDEVVLHRQVGAAAVGRRDDLTHDPEQVPKVAAGSEDDPAERVLVAQELPPVDAPGDHLCHLRDPRLERFAVLPPDVRDWDRPDGAVERKRSRRGELEHRRHRVDHVVRAELELVAVTQEQIPNRRGVAQLLQTVDDEHHAP